MDGSKAFTETVSISGEGPGEITGYLAVFNNVDRMNEVIQRGAFAKSIKENNGKGWPLMSRHFVQGGDAPEVLGTIVEAKEDAKGLWIRATLASDQVAQAMRAKIVDGHVSGLSVGYRILQQSPEMLGNGKSITKLTELKLREGTVTVFPVNELAAITGAKSEAPADLREMIRALIQEELASGKSEDKAVEDTLLDDRDTAMQLAVQRSRIKLEKARI